MGYGNPDLEEVPTIALEAELSRRELCHERKVCPYCGMKLDVHTCKFSKDQPSFDFTYPWRNHSADNVV